MEQVLHIKYVVKVITITKPLQKTHFTIRHPENASCLSGIAVTTNAYAAPLMIRDGAKAPTDNAGFLSLAVPNKGDVFYTEDVKVERDEYRDKIEQLIKPTFITPDFEFSGKKFGYMDTAMPVNDAFMEGYYEDLFFQTGFIGGGIGGPKGEGGGDFIPRILTGYKVTLYLRYIVNEKEIIETPKPCN